MKKNRLKNIDYFNITTAIIGVISGFALNYFNYLAKQIYMPVWVIILTVAAPNLIYIIVRVIWLRQKRIFRHKTLVSIIADERKFMVVRYHRYRPLCAVCKEVDKNSVIWVHQDYITKWEEPDTDSFTKLLDPRPNINTAVITGRMEML